MDALIGLLFHQNYNTIRKRRIFMPDVIKITKQDLPNILHKLLHDNFNGRAEMMDIFKKFYKVYEDALKNSDDLFYTWNYDIRWAATELRKQKIMKPASSKENPEGLYESPRGIWELE
jgi:hypothetical protein